VCSSDFCTAWAASKGNTVGFIEATLAVVNAAHAAVCLIITLGSLGSIYINLTDESTTEHEILTDDKISDLLQSKAPLTPPTKFNRSIIREYNILLGSKRRQALHCPAYPLQPDEIVDTTAAGDVFIACICRGVVDGNDAVSILLDASKLAALKCRQTGNVFDIIPDITAE
jgi:hypothetical protein